MKKLFLAGLLVLSISSLPAQNRAFNQNSSRSNHTRLMGGENDWQFGIQSGASFGIGSNEGSLFRGNGFLSGLNGHYFFGPLGLGVQGGFISSRLNSSAINSFLVERRFPQTSVVTTSPAQSGFLLLGPSYRFGHKAQLMAGLKGGLFFNQSGGLSVGQPGAARPLYRFENGSNSLFPGFNGSLSFSYPLGSSTCLVFSTDYLRSSASVQLVDPQRGIDLPVEQKRNFQTINAGISFIKSFGRTSTRNRGGSVADGNERGGLSGPVAETPSGTNPANARGIDKKKQKAWTLANYRTAAASAGPGIDGDTSIIDPSRNRVLKTKTRSNQSNDRAAAPGCGPVTIRTTRPDGTQEEQIFSCPEDAATYQERMGVGNNNGVPNRISTNVTSPRQTESGMLDELNKTKNPPPRGTAVGTVNITAREVGLLGSAMPGAGVISGRIIRQSQGGGIVTNRSQFGSAGALTNPGLSASFYIRESARGQQPVRQTYQPVPEDSLAGGEGTASRMGHVKNNPLYKGKGTTQNPLHRSGMTGQPGCDDQDLLLDVHLIDRNTGAVVASTQTNACGEYWFANVPYGNYRVQVMASIQSKKSYDFYSARGGSPVDMAGVVTVPQETWQHIVYRSAPSSGGGAAANGGSGKAPASWTLVMGDVDGDGEVDVTVQIRYSDGSSERIPGGKLSAHAPSVTIPVGETSQQKAGVSTSRSNVRNLMIAAGDPAASGSAGYTVQATFGDGTTRDITNDCDIQYQPGVTQINVATGDLDGDGRADMIWSPRTNTAVTAQSASQRLPDFAGRMMNPVASVRTLSLQTGDLDGDGAEELIIGNGKLSDFGMSRLGGRFQEGDQPGQPAFSLARPGNPIKGIIVKGGKNPGGDIVVSGRTNALGEFEFPGLASGDYTFFVEGYFVVYDETDIDLFAEEEPGPRSPDSKAGTVDEKKARQ